MAEIRQIIYFYNSKVAECETQVDSEGTIPVPVKGDIRFRNRERWKVKVVTTERRGPTTVIHKVYLGEA
jgi:hypothetical protein